MTNSQIENKLALTAKLMELYGDNPFKIRSYQTAGDTIYNLQKELSTLSSEEIIAIEGIGKGMATNISALLTTGTFDGLQQLLDQTPPGVIEMLSISGFGPKKVNVLWKEAGAETLDDLLLMCKRGQVAGLKGFGDKSQETLMNAVEFLIGCRGKEKYAKVEPMMKIIVEQLNKISGVELASETGDLRRRMEIIETMDFVVSTNDFEKCRSAINSLNGFVEDEKHSGPFTWVGNVEKLTLPVKIRFSQPDQFYVNLIKTTGTVSHLNTVLSDGSTLHSQLRHKISSEEDLYTSKNLPYIVPELREGMKEIQWAQQGQLPNLIEMGDLKGILHNHSTYSDGKHTLRQMAEHCRDLGYEYLGISDHSQTAVYARGLQEFTVKQQQEEIAQLNQELAPFKIFSGIESDILADGSLDYSEDILSSFDFIVASIHSGLNMDKAKATARLIAAIYNPYTTILGHMTGRLILEREGYPVDHKAIIDACADRGVVIEINASPYRLDMDWRWIHYAIEKGVKLSINPDAHKMEGYQDMYYGVLAGRKGGLTEEMNLNSMSRVEIEAYFESRKLVKK